MTPVHAAPALLLLSLVGCSPTPAPGAPGEAPAATAGTRAPAGAASALATPAAATPGGATPAAEAPPAPKPDVALTPEQRRAYLAALDAGRKAHRAKDYAAAVAAFDAALALQPDDARPLAERGWARFQGGQLPEAEADARAALARTTDARLLGGTWYNLGRVLEAQAKPEDAASAYRTSLGFRPNDTVAKRLAGLPGGVRDPYTATPMRGPYPTLDAWCAARVAAGRAEGPDAPAVVCDGGGGPLGESYDGPATAAGGPFQEVRVLAVARPLFDDGPADGPGERSFALAVRTAAGWYTRDDIVAAYNPGAFGIFQAVNGDALAVENDRVRFAYTHNRHDSDLGLNEVQTDDDSFVVVCAVGPQGPSCVDPIVTATRSAREILMEDEPEEPGTEHTLFSRAWVGAARVTPEGAVEVTGPPNADLPGHVGTHRLVFP